jgi:hypothetical protein
MAAGEEPHTLVLLVPQILLQQAASGSEAEADSSRKGARSSDVERGNVHF